MCHISDYMSRVIATEPIDISVIVPAHSRSRELRYLLKSLRTQNLNYSDAHSDTHLNVEVLVVANPPHLQIKKIVQEYSDSRLPVTYLISNSVGVNSARNIGIEAASGDILLFLDDDCELIDTDYLLRVKLLHARYANATGIGGPYLLANTFSPSAIAYHFVAMTWIQSMQTSQKQSYALLGGNASYKRKLIADHRFNAKICFGGSETEFNSRLVQDNKYLYFFEDLAVRHHCKMDLLNLRKKAYLQGHTAADLTAKKLTMLKLPELSLIEAYPRLSCDLKLIKKVQVLFCIEIYRRFFRLGCGHWGTRYLNGPLFLKTVLQACFEVLQVLKAAQVKSL